MLVWIFLLMMLFVGGCAATPRDFDKQYISADRYRGHTCAEIASEGERVARRAAEILNSVEDTQSSGWLLPPAIVLLLPTIPPSDDSTVADLRRLSASGTLRFQERFI
jgi:hypothetical protein